MWITSISISSNNTISVDLQGQITEVQDLLSAYHNLHNYNFILQPVEPMNQEYLLNRMKKLKIEIKECEAKLKELQDAG